MMRPRSEENADKSQVSDDGAAPGAAHKTKLSPDLARIVAAWSKLPKAIKRAMLALID